MLSSIFLQDSFLDSQNIGTTLTSIFIVALLCFDTKGTELRNLHDCMNASKLWMLNIGIEIGYCTEYFRDGRKLNRENILFPGESSRIFDMLCNSRNFT